MGSDKANSLRASSSVTLGWAAQCSIPLALSNFRNITTVRPVRGLVKLSRKMSDPNQSFSFLDSIAMVSNLLLTIFIIWASFKIITKALKWILSLYHLELYYFPKFWNVIPFAWYKDTAINMLLLKPVVDAFHFQVDDRDVFVASFPRSGTTWTQEMVYLISNDADIEKASSKTLDERFPYFEDPFRGPKAISKYPSPRLIKTHLPFHLLPKQVQEGKAKVVCVMRNPKDVIVSNYYVFKKISFGFTGSFDDFCQVMHENKCTFSPWWKHVKGYWEHRQNDNILVLKYEDIKRDSRSAVLRIADFLGKKLTETQLSNVLSHCSFDSMKANDKVNNPWWSKVWLSRKVGHDFIRKGLVGDWRSHFSPNWNSHIDRMVEDKLGKTGLTFDYDISVKQ